MLDITGVLRPVDKLDRVVCLGADKLPPLERDVGIINVLETPVRVTEEALTESLDLELLVDDEAGGIALLAEFWFDDAIVVPDIEELRGSEVEAGRPTALI